ncbi:unnamed protein product [Bemisia tabaci]|nr:unnamed protein product [Bemisia tabaci]
MRKIFRSFYSQQQVSLQSMLDLVGLDFEGRPHCGLDDAVNIARIFIQMIKDGAPLRYNEAIRQNKSPSSNLYVQNYHGNEWEKKYKESEKYMYREMNGLLYILDSNKSKKSKKQKGKKVQRDS